MFSFSYNNFFTTCFSIKFTQGDTVFIAQHWAPYLSEMPKSGGKYYAIISDNDRQKVDSFINVINFKNLDTLYDERYEDGMEYGFYIEKESLKKTIYVHSYSVPDEVKKFAFWITALKEKLTLYPTNIPIDFGNLKNLLPPPPKTKIAMTIQTGYTRLGKT